MKLAELFKGITYELIKGTMDEVIKDIAYDSRYVHNGTLFLANFGITEDNSKYIPNAIKNGANVIVISENLDIPDDITIIKVKNTNKVLSYLSMNFFDYPQNKLTTIAITGTKGKTTTSFMLKKIIETAGYSCGLIGTTGVYIDNIKYPTNNTTPASYDTIKYLAEMVKKRITYAIMEVSSQALKYYRTEGIIYDYAIFTNIAKDHISEFEHSNMEDYILSKSKLFKQCHYGILNIDDEHYQDMIKDCICQIATYGYHKDATLKAKSIKLLHKKEFMGIKLITTGLIKSKFKISNPGIFSSYNAMAAILTSYLLGIDAKYIKSLNNFFVPGRAEVIKVSNNISIIIDYAHNGSSTKSILSTIKLYHPKRIITIFGCGGNRSRERRYEMGKTAGLYSNFCIITEDNNRYEEFDNIVKDILTGIHKTDCPYVIIPKRKDAIKYAIENAQKGDIIMLLGKGHEDYLEINGKKYPFNEKSIIEEILQKK